MNDSKLSGTTEYIPERVFVVGGDESGSRTTCRGDSGSPVVRFRQNRQTHAGHWEVIGIVSWSRGCGRRFRDAIQCCREIHLFDLISPNGMLCSS